MTKVHGLFQAGFSWRLGDGITINLWNDNWLPNNNCLRKSIQGPLTYLEEQLIVSLIISNHSWFLDRISLSLPYEIIDKINRTYILFSTHKPDHSFWNQTTLGNFTTKSAYLSQLQITNQLPLTTPINRSWI